MQLPEAYLRLLLWLLVLCGGIFFTLRLLIRPVKRVSADGKSTTRAADKPNRKERSTVLIIVLVILIIAALATLVALARMHS